MKTWIWGAEATAPAAATQLIKIIPAVGKIGVLYGIHYVSQEAVAAGKVARVRLNIAATAVVAVTLDVVGNSNPFISQNSIAALRGNGVDFIEVVNVVAGTASTIHRVGLLYDEINAEDFTLGSSRLTSGNYPCEK